MELGELPDEVMAVVFGLAVVFGCCDARTRMMTMPALSRRWLRIGQ